MWLLSDPATGLHGYADTVLLSYNAMGLCCSLGTCLSGLSAVLWCIQTITQFLMALMFNLFRNGRKNEQCHGVP